MNLSFSIITTACLIIIMIVSQSDAFTFHRTVSCHQKTGTWLSSYLDSLERNDSNTGDEARDITDVASTPPVPSALNDPNSPHRNRFSALAPDANALNAKEFQDQLKENMNADIRERSQKHSVRGNRVANNYMDSL